MLQGAHDMVNLALRRRYPQKTSAAVQSEGRLDGMAQQAWLRIVPVRKNSATRRETQGPIHV